MVNLAMPNVATSSHSTFGRNHAAKVKSHERDDAVKRLGMYREWFESTILENEDHPVLLVPIENLTPRYRNIPEESV